MIFRYISFVMLFVFAVTASSASAATSQDVTALWAVVQSLQKEIATQKNTQGASVVNTTLPADIDPQAAQTSACTSLTKDIRYRSTDSTTGGEVSLLQDFLNSQGLFNQEATGYAGLVTVKAIKDFQSKYGISPTGFVGPLTRAKVKDVSCNTTTSVVPTTPTVPQQTTPQTSTKPTTDTTKTTSPNTTNTTSAGTPVLSMIYPTTANPGVSVYLYGENFSSDDTKVYLDTLVLTPKVVSPTVAMIMVPEQFVGGTYTFTVTVEKKGVKSKGLPLTVVASLATQTTVTPIISSINPSAGSFGTSLTLFGTGLFNTSLVEIYSANTLIGKAERFYTASNGTAVTFTLSDYLFSSTPRIGSTLEIGILSDGKTRSNRIPFTLASSTTTISPIATSTVPVPPVTLKNPVISSVTPSAVKPGEALYVYGENFESNSVIEINAAAYPTTILSSSKASVRIGDGATAGSYIVTVRTGTVQSNGVPFSVTVPTVTSQTPVITTTSSTQPSGTSGTTNTTTNTATPTATTKTPSISLVTPNPINPGVTLYVYGDGFDSSSVVELNAAAYPTTVLSQYVVSVRIPDSMTTGSYMVTVRNGTVKSGGVSLTVSR